MKKSWVFYAQHILDCIDKLDAIQERGNPLEDAILYDALLRNLQTLSEATRHLPQPLLQRYKGVPWSDIWGFRNILVHDYLGEIDAQTVAVVVQDHIKPLHEVIQKMLNEHADESF